MTPARRALILVAAVAACLPAEAAEVGAFLARHCHSCHTGSDAEAGLDLAALAEDVGAERTTWIAIHDRISSGEMPPAEEPRPKPTEQAEVITAIAERLRTADDLERRTAGRAVTRRLTAAEFENALRDLLHLPDLEVRQFLPADGTRRGFDKVGMGLDLSHVQVQQYLAAVDRALDLAIATRSTPPPVLAKRFEVAPMLKFRQNLNAGNAILINGLEADTGWHGDGRKDPKEPAEDPPGVLAGGKSVGFFAPNIAGQEKFVSFVPLVAGRYRLRMSIWSFLWDHGRVAPSPRTEVALLQAQGRVLGYFDAPSMSPTVHEVEAWLTDAGPPAFDVASLSWQSGRSRDERPGIAIDWIEVEGPLHETWPPASHRALFGDLPIERMEPSTVARLRVPHAFRDARWAWPALRDLPAAERSPVAESVASAAPVADATRLFAAFLPRAFRRPVAADEVGRYVAIVEGRLRAGDAFEDAMRQGYRAALVSPSFLFRREEPGRLDDHALATRLALWLWNGPPDEHLFGLAAAGRLADPAVRDAEIERMLADPRSQRFVSDFLDQWLKLKSIDDTDPDRKLYPEFQHLYLKESMLAESRAFLRELLTSDLPVTNLVVSDFAMLNERLARHYSISGLDPAAVAGSRIRRVALPKGSHRGGFLTQGAVLKVTANGTTTSPVIRGVFVSERFLGLEVPPPPPNVPAIEPDTRGATTVRELLARHRADAACAGCHRKIDPAGFALERFDPVGGWRDRYRSEGRGEPVVMELADGSTARLRLAAPVDASGELADGRPFTDFEEFRRLLVADADGLARAFVTQMAIYATGAEPAFADRAEIDRIVRETSRTGHGIRSVVHAIADSPLFLEK